MSTVRWYNRLAAWLWPWIGDPLLDLAAPVWEQGVEEEAEAFDDMAEALDGLARSMLPEDHSE